MKPFAYTDHFVDRHLGINRKHESAMLQAIGVDSMEDLIAQTIPSQIRRKDQLNIAPAISEFELLQELREIGQRNKEYKNYIGLGYYPTITPPVIQRNIFENPGWYTQYTPYQAEISQGRLEALLNFQTVVSDLTGLPIANASLLDEATAVAEGMIMAFNVKNRRNKGDLIKKCFVDNGVLPQTLDVLRTRAKYLHIEIEIGEWSSFKANQEYFACILQYPTINGSVEDYQGFVSDIKSEGLLTIVAADLMSLALLKPPGEWGADIVVGNTQRFGVPMGYGGPHAAYFATLEDYKRQIPGRLIGLSQDADDNPALRMALQTREQHIKREKATSNICTAQALLAVMAGMYAVYHGASGIKAIATRIHLLAIHLEKGLKLLGLQPQNQAYFDTLFIQLSDEEIRNVQDVALEEGVNFGYTRNGIRIALNETTSIEDIDEVVGIFQIALQKEPIVIPSNGIQAKIPSSLHRSSSYLSHPTFDNYRTETELMRYIKSLENKDLSLVHSMIPLGSCTMKLNAAVQLMPVSWSSFANIHPFAPVDQAIGYQEIFDRLEKDLSEITGFADCSLQPNSGAQGEYAGLLTIRAYHDAHGDFDRNVTLIPSSAHGTNPASAVMCGMQVVVTKCDDHGNIDLSDLQDKIDKHKDHLACLMVTYPSTHGVFEEEIRTICDMIHDNGGLVYMDGANMNAQVGLTSPGLIHADVCHLNLHKT
ncbi:MAG: aminomethyl-transferring glycine dehydrogenase, partial [Bacteroidia bacterium]|nr:aminomethyl-transferring glycine dehydrogenase [Bacteroidia bacterium]